MAYRCVASLASKGNERPQRSHAIKRTQAVYMSNRDEETHTRPLSHLDCRTNRLTGHIRYCWYKRTCDLINSLSESADALCLDGWACWPWPTELGRPTGLKSLSVVSLLLGGAAGGQYC